MSDLTPFKPTVQDVKDIVNMYDDQAGNPLQCTDEQAQKVLDRWFDQLADSFYDFVKSEVMEGDVLNVDEEE